MTPPTGWSLLTSIASSGGTTAQYVYTKVATGAEPASYAFSWAGGSGASDSSGVILAYAGIWAGAGSNIDATTSCDRERDDDGHDRRTDRRVHAGHDPGALRHSRQLVLHDTRRA